MRMIEITEVQYDQLLTDSQKLDALEMFGVDNWGGYSDAMDYLTGEEPYDEN